MSGVDAWDVNFLCDTFRPGSQGDDWTWADEAAWVIRNHADKLAALVEDVAANGIQEPVLLGTDGRIWDGHHRILAARLTGRAVPTRAAVDHAPPPGVCHCGKPTHVYDDGFTRDLCEDCSTVRCDAYPGA